MAKSSPSSKASKTKSSLISSSKKTLNHSIKLHIKIGNMLFAIALVVILSASIWIVARAENKPYVILRTYSDCVKFGGMVTADTQAMCELGNLKFVK